MARFQRVVALLPGRSKRVALVSGRRLRARFEPLESRCLLAGDPIITELMASNSGALLDGDGESSDWIEILNDGDAPVDLAGWYLTDAADDLTQWAFPDDPISELLPGEHLVLFASGEHLDGTQTPIDPYFDAGGHLHVPFKLDANGEYLALVEPGGPTIRSQFSPDGTDYPLQVMNISYGLGRTGNSVTLITVGADVEVLVPDESLELTWTEADFIPDESWVQGTTGVGFDTADGYDELLGTDVEAQMLGVNATAYMRVPFSVDDPGDVESLALRMQYDDGFIAYLNGEEIARRNAAPASGVTTATFDSTNAANGLSWADGYSVTTREDHLEIGAFGTFRERTLLRFDVSSLAGIYTSIESVTLRLTTLAQVGGGSGTVELFRVDDTQTGWTDQATLSEMDGDGYKPAGDAGSVPWVGGVDMFSTHTGSALASTTVARNDAVGTVYEWSVTGAAAEALINEWTTGVN